MLRRYAPLKATSGTRWPSEVRAAILLRDGGRCVCTRAGFPLEVIARCPSVPVELDHVRAGGMGMKSRSTVDNGVALSAWCHKWKTEHGRVARPLLLAYIENADHGHVEPVHGCDQCIQPPDPWTTGLLR